MKTTNMIALLALTLSLTAHAESGAGNGGDVLICKDEKTGAETHEIVDIYEGRTLRDFSYAELSNSLTLREQVYARLDALAIVDAARSALYRIKADHYLSLVDNGSAFILKGKLQDIPDHGNLIIPENCHIEQIASQMKVRHPGDKELLIVKKLWDKLSRNSQSHLILHEVVYNEALENEQTNSINTRFINALINSEEIKTIHITSYYYHIRDADLPIWLSLKGYSYEYDHKTKTDIKTYTNNIVHAYPDPNSLQYGLSRSGKVFIQRANLAGRALYFPGEVDKNTPHSLTLDIDQIHKGAEIEFYEDGSIYSIENMEDSVENGRVFIHANLSDDPKDWTMIEIQYPNGNNIRPLVELYPDGRVRRAAIPTEPTRLSANETLFRVVQSPVNHELRKYSGSSININKVCKQIIDEQWAVNSSLTPTVEKPNQCHIYWTKEAQVLAILPEERSVGYFHGNNRGTLLNTLQTMLTPRTKQSPLFKEFVINGKDVRSEITPFQSDTDFIERHPLSIKGLDNIRYYQCRRESYNLIDRENTLRGICNFDEKVAPEFLRYDLFPFAMTVDMETGQSRFVAILNDYLLVGSMTLHTHNGDTLTREESYRVSGGVEIQGFIYDLRMIRPDLFVTLSREKLDEFYTNVFSRSAPVAIGTFKMDSRLIAGEDE